MPLTLTIPDSIADAIRLPEDRLPTELLCEPSVALCAHGPPFVWGPAFRRSCRAHSARGLLAFGKAREVAGLAKCDFSQLLAAPGVTGHYTREGVQDDLDDADDSLSNPRAMRRRAHAGTSRT